jgi:hypothetical protein
MLRVKDQARQNERDTESAGSALEGGMWALDLCKAARERWSIIISKESQK